MEPRLKPITLLAMAVLALTLTTCSNPFDFVAEITDQVMLANDLYLVVADVTPSKYATGVNTWAPIVIEFDRDIDASTVSETTIIFKDENQASVTWRYNYNPATKALSLMPFELNGDLDFTITVTNGVKGSDGSSVREDFSWTFTTVPSPSGTMVINDANGYVNSTSVTLTITKNIYVAFFRVCAADAGGLPTFDPGDTDWIAIGSVTWPLTTHAATLLGTQGTNTLFIQYRDNLNNRSPADAISDDIYYDNVKPSVSAGTMSWLNNATQSRTTNSTASDSGSGIASYAWSGAGLSFSSAAVLNPTISSTADGTYTATLVVTDRAGNTETKTLTVNRDITLPTVSAGTLPWLNVSNASRATSATASDANSMTYLWTGPTQLAFSPSNTLNTTISGTTDGTYTATLTVTDAAGNVRTSNLTVNRDRVAPTVSSISIASGATYSTSLTVALTLAASDTGTSGLSQMQFSNDGGGVWSTLQGYATSKSGYVLAAGGDGTRTVTWRVTDVAGNISTTGADSITVDSTPPVVTVFTIGSGNPSNANSASVTLYITATDTGGSGVYQSRYRNQGQAWTVWEAYTATKSWTLEDLKGTRRVYLGVSDVAGNTTALNGTWDEIILNARIVITYTQAFITNDGDSTGAGEIYYDLRVNGTTRLSRPEASYRSVTSPAYITSAYLPQTTTPTIYIDPLTGGFTLSAYFYDDDFPLADDSGSGGDTLSAPFSDATGATFSFGGDVAGIIYYNMDVQN